MEFEGVSLGGRSTLKDSDEGPEPQFINKWTHCPNGHRIRLEVLTNTPNTIQIIRCPTCDADALIIAGDLRGVIPDPE